MKKTLVMLYGLCGSPLHFSEQERYFLDKADVYVPDWFEFCKSLVGENVTIQAISQKIIEHLNNKGIRNPLLVGHSMGGVIALTMVAGLNYPVDRLIILDSSLTPTAEKRKAYLELYQQFLIAPDKSALIDHFFRERLFLPTDDTELKEKIITLAKSRPDPFWFKALESAVNSDFESMIASIKVPCLYIGSTSPYADIEQLKKINPTINFIQVRKPSGHFISLFAWDEVNQFIEHFE